MTAVTTRSPRLTADERREAIVAAALDEFAARGLAGASTDTIAARAGVSQPYVFQLFKTKKELFLAVVRHGFARTRLAFEDSARRQRSGSIEGCNSVLEAMGLEYMSLLADRTLLLVQLQAYAACADPDVQRVVREEFGALHRYVAEALRRIGRRDPAVLRQGDAAQRCGRREPLEGEPLSWSLDALGGGA